MLEYVYEKDNIDLIYDTNEDTYYISVDGGGVVGVVCCSQDYTKEELITILKDMIKTLED